MKATPVSAADEIEVGPGECLRLPDDVAKQFAEGTWILSISAKDSFEEHSRDRSSFLSAYSEEDEGLYDDSVPAG